MKHNKKRNVGLLNEFFARYMAKAIIEKRDSDLAKAKELFAKHFQPGTDLHRELKVFTALFETRLVSPAGAITLIDQAKQACKLQSQARLDLEKSALLHEVNIRLNDPEFFNESINEYRDYATIQVLMNHWRGGLLTENLGEVAQLEDKLLVSLTSKPTTEIKKEALGMTTNDVDSLVVRLMAKKLNEKYADKLDSDQRKILNLYVFSQSNSDAKNTLSNLLESLRQDTLRQLDESLRTDREAQKIETKLLEVKKMLLNEYKDTSINDDNAITFYLSVSKLQKELKNE